MKESAISVAKMFSKINNKSQHVQHIDFESS